MRVCSKSRRVRVAVATLVLALPVAAQAHAILLSSRPAVGGTLPAGHQALQFRFNSRIDQRRSRLTLVGPSGTATVLPVEPDGPADQLAAEADLVTGSYRLRWQALATDGHITRGDVPFTVTGGSPSAATP